MNHKGNAEGIDLVKSMIEKIEKKEFPLATLQGSIIEFDIAIKVKNDYIDLTFLEMSGEDLEGFISSSKITTIKSEIEKYLEANISINFLLVADYESVEKII